jgi:hypothetical protein
VADAVEITTHEHAPDALQHQRRLRVALSSAKSAPAPAPTASAWGRPPPVPPPSPARPPLLCARRRRRQGGMTTQRSAAWGVPQLVRMKPLPPCFPPPLCCRPHRHAAPTPRRPPCSRNHNQKNVVGRGVGDSSTNRTCIISGSCPCDRCGPSCGSATSPSAVAGCLVWLVGWTTLGWSAGQAR